MAATAAVRVATPEIRWHCGPTGLNEAVLSLDFLPAAADDSGAVVLATGGADKEIKLWRVRDALGDGAAADDKSGKDDKDDGEDAAEKEGGRGKSDAVRGLEFVFSLSGHDRSVNCVRFSPNGEFLASASDDTSVILWTRPKTAGPDWRWDTVAALSDVARTILSLGHKGDITDLAWSPDSQFLCSTSIDNRSVIWHVGKGDVVERRKDHTQYVQGAAWDPLNEFVVTEGNDRTCRVYALGGFTRQTAGRKSGRKMTCVQTIKTREFPSSVDEEKQAEQNKPAASAAPQQSDSRPAPPKHRMFLDDTCPAFARRPAWTPDGSYLLTPTGTFRATESAKAVNTVYAFARGDLSAPTLHLPGHDKASLAVRCSPLVYELRDGDKTGNFFQTNYRSIFAVVTLNAIVLYDTQQAHPICTVKDMHYADLTDASWSADGQTLSVSSMDGYLSFIRFAPGFFGTSLPPQKLAEENEAKMSRMFAVHKKIRKKSAGKSQVASVASPSTGVPTAASAPTVAATTNILTVKKKPSAKLPAAQSIDKAISAAAVGSTNSSSASPKRQNDETNSSASAVNVLQVRKKRKIVPTIVSATSATTSAAAAGDAGVADLRETAGRPAQPEQAQEQTAQTTAASPHGDGTAESPVEI